MLGREGRELWASAGPTQKPPLQPDVKSTRQYIHEVSVAFCGQRIGSALRPRRAGAFGSNVNGNNEFCLSSVSWSILSGALT